MTPDKSCARAIDHAAGVATSITPTIANVDAKRRGAPSERDRITSTTETNRVNTERTAIACKARRKFLSSTSEVISLRRTSATTIVAIGMTTPSNSRAADSVVRRNSDGAPGTRSAPITDPDGPLLPDSSSLGVVVDGSISANRFNALCSLGVARSVKSGRSGGKATPKPYDASTRCSCHLRTLCCVVRYLLHGFVCRKHVALV